MNQARRKLQQRLERKIQQKKKQKQSISNSEMQQSFVSTGSAAKTNIRQWMKALEMQYEDEPQFSGPNNNKFNQLEQLGQEDEKQLQQTRDSIHLQEKKIDELKYRLIEVTRQLQALHGQKQTRTYKYQGEAQELTRRYKQQFEQIKTHYQQKIDKYLQQIDKLLQEKAEFNQQCQVFLQEDAKMNKAIKDLEERQRKDIKNAREAFLVLEKERRQKWQQNRIKDMKEQATLRLEPKLQAIIKDSNQDIKKAATEWQQKNEQFKRQYTGQVNKKLQQLKQSGFQQSEKQKEVLRAEERKKLKDAYERLQAEFEEDRTKLRKMYKQQILTEQQKRREELNSFLNNNKYSQEEHLANIKKVRDDYEEKIRQMKQNVRQRVSQQLTRVQRLYKSKLEEAEKQIEAQSMEKFERAKKKIDESIATRQRQARLRIKNEGQQLERDIDAKYQKKYIKAKKQIEEQKEKLRQKLRQTQQRLIAEQRAQSNEISKNTTYHKQFLKVTGKNNEILLQIKQKQDSIARIRQGIAETNLQYQQQIKKLQQQKRKQYEKIDQLIGRKRQEKEQVEDQLLEKYTQMDDANMERIEKLKNEKNTEIKNQTEECKKLMRKLEQLQTENAKLNQQVKQTRNKIIK